MATYFTARSAFKPYSFEELIAPLNMYKTEYDKREAEISALQSQGALIEGLMGDTEAYKEYRTELERVRDDLYNNGLASGTRKDIQNLSAKLLPIASGAEAYKGMITDRAKLKGQDDSVVFMNEYTPEDLMGGKVPDNSFISGKQIATRIAAKAGTYGENILRDPEMTRILNDKYLMRLNAGASLEEIQAAMSQDPEVQSILKDIYAEEWKAAGMNNLSSDKQAELLPYFTTGLFAALRAPKTQVVNYNPYAYNEELRAQGLYERQIDKADAEAAARNIASGQAPYAEDPATGTKYYSNGKQTWATDAEGKMLGAPVNISTRSTKTEEGEEVELGSNLIIYAENRAGDKGKKFLLSPTNAGRVKSQEFDLKDAKYVPLNELNELPAAQLKKLEDYLISEGVDINDIEVYKDSDKRTHNHFYIATRDAVSPELKLLRSRFNNEIELDFSKRVQTAEEEDDAPAGL